MMLSPEGCGLLARMTRIRHPRPRITRIGKILRKMRIDEIPQFINVLHKDMSLVGPRPEISKYVELFENDYKDGCNSGAND